MNFITELKRRNVFRVGLAYMISAWVIAQVVDLVLESIHAPDWVLQTLLLLLGLGFIAALIIAWAYELTPEGIKKEKDILRDDSITNITGKKLNYITLMAAVSVLALFVYQQMNPPTATLPTQANKQTEAHPVDHSLRRNNNPAFKNKSAANQIPEKSIAVLPFVNMSADKDQEYFADGISEEILNALVKATGLRVAGRTSSFSFKGKDTTIKKIGEMLKVTYVLEGSVRKQGQAVRITAQLIKVDDGFHLWSETYDGTLENIFDLQEDISRKVTHELKLLLKLGSGQRLAGKMTTNIDAYELFLRGREKVRKRIENNIPEGIVLLQQAVELDPNFAEAWAKLAEAEAVSSSYTNVENDLALARAQKHIDKALAINSKLALPYAIKSFFATDLLSSFDGLTQALELEPNNVIATRWLGTNYSVLGLEQKALSLYQKAYDIDPLSSVETFNLGMTHFKLGNLEQAIHFLKITGDLRSKNIEPILAYLYDFQGQREKAIDSYLAGYKLLIKKNGPQAYVTEEQIKTYALAAFSGSAEEKKTARNIGKIVRSGPDNQEVWQLLGHLAIDNIDRVFEILEQKPDFFLNFAEDYMWLPLKGIKKFRADPRFIPLLQKYELPMTWQQFGWPEYCQPNEGTDGSDGQFQCH